MKICIKCNAKKPLLEFHTSNKCNDGHRGSCKVCTNKENKHRRALVNRVKENNGVLALPPVDRLDTLFEYNDGELIRKVSLGSSRAGGVVGVGSNQKYKRCVVDGVHYLIHRVIWKLLKGYDAIEIDHINGSHTDNRIENMREVTHLVNSQNLPIKVNNTSGVSGVNWHKVSNKWNSRISVNGVRICLGLFDSFGEAVKVRKDAEKKYGYHENHGRIKP